MAFTYICTANMGCSDGANRLGGRSVSVGECGMVNVVDGRLEVVGPSMSDASGIRKYEFLRIRQANGTDVLIKDVHAMHLVASYLFPDLEGRYVFSNQGIDKLIAVKGPDRVINDYDNWKQDFRLGLMVASVMVFGPIIGAIIAVQFEIGWLAIISILAMLPLWWWGALLFSGNMKSLPPSRLKVERALQQT
jgi:hypothetical protein